jgi:hypothetical protein
MRRNIAAIALASVIVILIPGILALAQELHKTYAIGAGGHILIKNVSGDVKVTGYNGGVVIVDAYPVGRDRDLVKVEDLSAGDRIELHVRYPESGNCDAGVNFDVRVPAGLDYNFDRLASVSGNIEVTSVRGSLRATSVSGDVTVKDVTGTVNASSVSGSVDAQITRIEGSGEMKFSSVSGSVNVKAPSNADADIEMSSVSGSLETDFPIQVQESRYGPGRSARGRVGTGANSLRVTTVSGKVSLTRN